jgi:hypothetical protein
LDAFEAALVVNGESSLSAGYGSFTPARLVEKQDMGCLSYSKMMKKAIENQESSPNGSPYVNIFYCMGLVTNSVVRLASLWWLYLVVQWHIQKPILNTRFTVAPTLSTFQPILGQMNHARNTGTRPSTDTDQTDEAR